MFKLVIEAFKEDVKTFREKFEAIFFLVYWAIGFICGVCFIIIPSTNILIKILGICVIILYAFIEGYFWDY